MNPSIIWLPNKYVGGWPSKDDARALLVPAGAALSRRCPSDAHFAAYGADLPRRHTIALLQRLEHADKIGAVNLRMALAVFDVDHVDHAHPGFVLPAAWWSEEKAKVVDLLAVHPGAFVYRTRGGYRVVYALPEPAPLRCQGDDDAWTAGYRSWVRYLRRRFAIVADEACGDWTRLYRVPHATRNGVLQELETLGDPHALGPWAPALQPGDVVAVKKTATARRTAPIGSSTSEVEPVPLGDLDGDYAYARVAAGTRYLQQCTLSIEGQRGRDVFFRAAAYLVRRLRLPIDAAAVLVEVEYNPRLLAVGTTPWLEPELTNRLESARVTATNVPPGDVPDEATWNELNPMGVATEGT